MQTLPPLPPPQSFGDPLRVTLRPCEKHQESDIVIEVGGQEVSTDFVLGWKGSDDECQIEYSYTRTGAPSLKLFRGGQLVESDAYPSGLRPALQRAVRPEGALYKLYHAMIEGRLTLEVTIVIITRHGGREEEAVH